MRLRMADEDREKYGGPEWLDFAEVPAWLDDRGYDELVAVEEEIASALGPDKSLLWVLDKLVSHTSEASTLPMIRVRLWLALRAAGVDLPLADFRPARMWGLKIGRPTGADAAPPGGAADSSPTWSPESAEATNLPTSESSTDASTPGPDASTA